MKTIKKSLILLIGLLPLCAVAQNDRDAFRFSFLTPTGTARFSSLAGSMGAFGADFSTASTNPAALGTYNRSEFTFTPSLYYGKSELTYNGNTYDDNKWNFNFGNLGVILTIPDAGGKWKAVQISTGINRMGNFHSYSYGRGSNDKRTSIIDNFTKAFSVSGDNVYGSYESYAAYNLYLTDTDALGFLHSNISNLDLIQDQSTCTKGSINEYVFSVSGNYDDILYVGATLGIPYFHYKTSGTYGEYNQEGGAFKYLQYGNELIQNGSGVNFKLGMLYQPFPFMRLGFAVHTPSFYDVEEHYSATLSAQHDSVGYKEYVVAFSDYEYRITTPYHILGDWAFMFKNYGFINLGYEFTDYKAMRLRADDYSFREENNQISQLYQGAHTLKVGGELNLSPLALRAGYAHSTNPFVEEGKDGSMDVLSAGLGFRNQYYYIDFAYVHQFYKETDIFYANAPFCYENVVSKNHFMLTMGWKF